MFIIIKDPQSCCHALRNHSKALLKREDKSKIYIQDTSSTYIFLERCLIPRRAQIRHLNFYNNLLQ